MDTTTRQPACPRCGTLLDATGCAGLCPRCLAASVLSEPVPPERCDEPVQIGDYQLLTPIARGSSGVVWRARQGRLGREVAIKLLADPWLAGESAARRFRIEAGAAAHLRHPHIITVYEVGEDDGHVFLSMELAEGGSLAERLRAGALDPRAGGAVVAKIARAMHYAHERGVLHRDLKPGNILLDAAGEPRVADFGLARRIGSDSSLTLAGSAVGTPAYMSPEAARGESDLTTAADLWGLGAILYELLAGRPPFVAENIPALLKKIVEDEPAKIQGPMGTQKEVPSVPRDLEIIALKCLRKDPAQRYPGAAALADDLDRFAAGEAIAARPVPPLERAWLWAKRRPAVAALTVSVALLLVVVAVGAAIGVVQIEQARREAENELWKSRLSQAHAGRLTTLPDRKFTGLAALAAAARVRPSLELRNEAIAHLALDAFIPPERSLPGRTVLDKAFTRCAFVEPDGTIVVRGLNDERELLRLAPLPGDETPSILFTPDGSGLFVFGSKTRRIDLSNGSERLLPGVHKPAISPDARWLASVTKESVLIRDAADGREVARIPSGAHQTAFHPDPECPIIALLMDDGAQLWDWRRATTFNAFIPAESDITAMAWDGDLLALGDSRGHLTTWNLATGRRWSTAPHRNVVSHLSFARGTQWLITGSWDATSCVLDAVTGQELMRSDRSHLQMVSADGKRGFFMTDTAWGVGHCEAASHPRRAFLADPQRNTGPRFSLDGRWLAVRCKGTLHVLDAASARPLLLQSIPDLMDVRFSLDGKTLFTVDRARMTQWKLAVRDGRLELAEPQDVTPPGADRLEVGRFNSTSSRYALPLTTSDAVVFEPGNPAGAVWLKGAGVLRYPSFSPDGRWIATGTFHGGGLRLWDAHSGADAGLVGAGNCRVAFSPDGRWIAGAFNDATRIFDSETRRLAREFSAETTTDLPGCSAWSANGRVLAHVRRHTLIDLIDTGTWELLGTLTSPGPRHVLDLEFSPTGMTLAAGTDGNSIELWDLPALGEDLARLGLGWKLDAGATATGAALMPDVKPLEVRPARPKGY